MQGIFLYFQRQAAALAASTGGDHPSYLEVEGAVLQHLETAFTHDIKLGQVRPLHPPTCTQLL